MVVSRARAASALAFIVLLTACGKRGPLVPPQRGVPAAPALSAVRIGDELRLTVTHSGLRENGKPLSPPESAELLFSGGALRVSEERPAAGHRVDYRWPVPVGGGEIEVSARWKDGRGRLSNPAAPVRFSLAAVAEAVDSFTATPEAGGLRLRFGASGAGVIALRLAEKTPDGEIALAEFPPGAREHLLTPVRDGEPRELILRALYAQAPPVLSAGRALSAAWEDRFPPAAPTSFQAFPGEEGVELYWPPPEDPDAAEAVIERSVGGGPFAPLARPAAGEGRHLDPAPPAGEPLLYRLRFADRARTPNLSESREAGARWTRPVPGGLP